MEHSHVVSNKAKNIINGVTGTIADILRKLGIVQPIALNECLVTLAASPTRM